MLYCTDEVQNAGKAAAFAEFSGLATECLFEAMPEGLSPFEQYDLIGPVRRWIELLYSAFGFLPHKNEFKPVGEFKMVGIPWDVHSMSARAIELALDGRFVDSVTPQLGNGSQPKETDPIVSISDIAKLAGYSGRNSITGAHIAKWGDPSLWNGNPTSQKFYNLFDILPILIRQYPHREEQLKRGVIELKRIPS